MRWSWLTRNFFWKLGSLTLSALLWFSIVGEPELTTTHVAPILYKSLPKDLLLGPETLDAVRIELRGPAGRLTSTSLSDMAVQLDLGTVTEPGERTFTLSDNDMHLPDGVTFLRAVPAQLRLQFARKKYKEVPVEVRLASTPPAGYVVAKQEVRPEAIQIAGPESSVDAITSALTDAIDLSRVTASQEFHVHTYVGDRQVWLESSPVIQVRLTIEKK
jgi:hypothetical protein